MLRICILSSSSGEGDDDYFELDGAEDGDDGLDGQEPFVSRGFGCSSIEANLKMSPWTSMSTVEDVECHPCYIRVDSKLG